jgi:hypothetical protein
VVEDVLLCDDVMLSDELLLLLLIECENGLFFKVL